ncbi:MAG: hypothetical protein ACOC33_00430 [bacterium]
MEDTRKFLKIMRDYVNSNNKINEDIKREISNQEFNEEKENFQNSVSIASTFGQFKIYDDYVSWGGNLEQLFDWEFTVSPDSEISSCLIFIDREGLKLDENNIELINKLYSYFLEFEEKWLQELLG